jgi:hypothetical protein
LLSTQVAPPPHPPQAVGTGQPLTYTFPQCPVQSAPGQEMSSHVWLPVLQPAYGPHDPQSSDPPHPSAAVPQ